jgi:hypothetical protein
MNATDVWSGNEYAVKENKPKGVDAPAGCAKVRAVRVIKRLEPGKVRETAYVISEILDIGNHYWWNKGERRELRARDFVDFWDDYSHRREEIEKEAKERQARIDAARAEEKRIIEERRRIREEKERIEQERIVEEQNKLLKTFCAVSGVPEHLVEVTPDRLSIRRSYELDLWLSVEGNRVV